MKYTKKIKQLGISEKDFKILSGLALLKRSKVLPLSEKVCISRTSVAFRLKKMEKRELTQKEKVGGHFEWKLTNYTENIFLENSGEGEFNITKYSSKKDIENIFLSILKDKSKERIYFIEPYTQTKEFIEKMEDDSIKNIAKVFQKEKNISEGVSSEKNIGIVKNYDKKVLEDMLGRATIVYAISDKYLSFEDMIFVYKNAVYIFNFQKWQAVKIESESFAKAVRSIILALKGLGKKVDMSELIRNALVRGFQ